MYWIFHQTLQLTTSLSLLSQLQMRNPKTPFCSSVCSVLDFQTSFLRWVSKVGWTTRLNPFISLNTKTKKMTQTNKQHKPFEKVESYFQYKLYSFNYMETQSPLLNFSCCEVYFLYWKINSSSFSVHPIFCIQVLSLKLIFSFYCILSVSLSYAYFM